MAAVLTALGALTIACGKKGPPLAPLHLVPAAVTEMSVRRVADRARVRFVLPSRNENGPGPIELDRVEIYAMTIPANSAEPSPRELMSRERLVGEIPVRPVLAEGEVAAPDEKRPEPGSPVTFDEDLTAEKLTPVEVKLPLQPVAAPLTAPSGPGTPPVATPATGATPPPAAAPATPPAATAPAAKPAEPATAPAAPATTTPPTAKAGEMPPTAAKAGEPAAPAAKPGEPATVPAVQKPATFPYPRRLYVARGVTRSGRPGGVSTRTSMPVVPLPPPPEKVTATFSETAITVQWEPAAGVAAYNIYRAGDLLQPINPAPLTAPAFEQAGAEPGKEQCYRIRGVTIVDPVSVEGEASAPQCVTPLDRFPPAAPRGLAAVPTAGQISLIWDANTEKDLAGYLVLRGEGPEGQLGAITAAPIKETSYRDTAVKPGVRYVYVIVALDTATPPNMSPQSARVEETAR
jgi:hypothetical protein